MDMKRERLVWGSVLAVLVFAVVFLLASSSDIRTADNLLLSLIALSILIVSVTIAIAIGTICLRLLRPNDSAATTSHLEGQVPIVAGPIALFGNSGGGFQARSSVETVPAAQKSLKAAQEPFLDAPFPVPGRATAGTGPARQAFTVCPTPPYGSRPGARSQYKRGGLHHRPACGGASSRRSAAPAGRRRTTGPRPGAGGFRASLPVPR